MKRSALIFLLFVLPFTLARFGLLAMYPKEFEGLNGWPLIEALLWGLRFDFAAVGALLILPFLVLNLPFKFSVHRLWQGAWYFLFSLLLVWELSLVVSDLIYYEFVKRHMTHEISMLGQDVGLIWSMMMESFVLEFTLFWVGAGVVVWGFFKLVRFQAEPVKWWRYGLMFLVMAILARGGFGSKPLAMIDAFLRPEPAYGNLAMNSLFSVGQSTLKASDVNHHFFELEKALKIAKPGVDGSAQYPLMTELKGKKEKQNLVFILVESLSYKYIDALTGKSLGLTPNLDRIVKDSWVLDRHFANGQRSLEGVQVTLTGVPSVIGMPTIGVGIMARYPSLGGILEQNGYDTLFVQAMKRSSFRGESIAKATGFTEYYGMEDMPLLLDYPDPDQAKFGWDHETLTLAHQKLNEQKEPFGAYVLTSTTHIPYPELPTGMAKFEHHASKESGFFNSLVYTDWALGQFFEKARKEPWFENTLFVITADHALPHYNENEGFLGLFHTPVLFYQPGKIQPKRDDQLASQLDLFPTMLEMIGVGGRISGIGSSLLHERRDPFAVIRWGPIMGLITEDGYLKHNLNQPLGHGFTRKVADEKKALKRMEIRLKAIDQVSWELLSANRWIE